MKPCKFCGRKPKLYYKHGRWFVRCKPFLKPTHWIVEAPTKESAIQYWNERMMTDQK